ncbi:UNKNOWN [Stylonychia lemnae]|uniref:Uncharacterized protein n=1 Tax=Stylonychia lemnae TaxID=5949 RepID=A0A078AX06_STYLE|nr:UNKNOWN [Stylonychia lemnae]|eukprot:CDW85787.1 UNKNOWN [Stylonychia lemnae]
MNSMYSTPVQTSGKANALYYDSPFQNRTNQTLHQSQSFPYQDQQMSPGKMRTLHPNFEQYIRSLEYENDLLKSNLNQVQMIQIPERNYPYYNDFENQFQVYSPQQAQQMQQAYNPHQRNYQQQQYQQPEITAFDQSMTHQIYDGVPFQEASYQPLNQVNQTVPDYQDPYDALYQSRPAKTSHQNHRQQKIESPLRKSDILFERREIFHNAPSPFFPKQEHPRHLTYV